MLPKEKDGIERAARPKIHGYLPLAEPLYDSDKFVRYCEWCIKTLGGDPKVKSKAQKMFGYGDNPNAFVEIWMGGRCIDEVLSDADLAAVVTPESEHETPVAPTARRSHKKNAAFVWFFESGEYLKHLCDLEALDWVFFERNGIMYVQTPLGDHSPGMHDGNIKDGVVYFHSKAPYPFVAKQGYSVCLLFTGALYGGIGNLFRQFVSDGNLPAPQGTDAER